MTELTIIPNVSDKTARFKGAIAAGEHVAVTIKGGADWLGEDDGANLTLRVIDETTRRTIAAFPRPAETLGANETADAWDSSDGDLTCMLNLNTVQAVNAARHMLRVPVLFVLGDVDSPRTLYFRDRHVVEYWPERIGDTVPYNLDNWPKQIDEWAETVAGFGTALSTHVADTVKHVTAAERTAWNAKYGKPNSGIPKGDLAEDVQTSLSKADTALQQHQDISGKVNSDDLFSDGKVKASLLPSYVDDVLEYASTSAFPATGETGKIYVAKDTNKTYRWSGTLYVELSPAPDLSNYVQKEVGKGLSTEDYTTAEKAKLAGIAEGATAVVVTAPSTSASASGKAADAKATGDALYGGFTPWVFSGDTYAGDNYTVGITGPVDGYYTYQLYVNFNPLASETYTTDDVLSVPFAVGPEATITASRHLITPTKTSQLTNDGAPNGGGTPYATTAQVAAKQDALSAAQLANIAAVPNKANAADLPYAMATPGEWTFSGAPTGYEPTGIAYDDLEGTWILTYIVQGEETDLITAQRTADDLLVVFTMDDENAITATRPSLPGHLLDRAGNRVVVTGATQLTLPDAVPGHIRDFLVRLEISGSTVPTITFAAPTGETIAYETDGDEFPVPDEVGNWVYSFTENCVAHTFAVSLKKVNVVAQGGS